MISVLEKVSLKKYNTYRVGGCAEYFVSVSNKKELLAALKLPIFPKTILGGGSNVLVPDEGIRGLVIVIKATTTPQFLPSTNCGVVVAFAGTMLARVVQFCEREGIAGFSWASGVPGTVGGALMMNAGCFGESISDRLIECEVYSVVSGQWSVLRNEGFSYRKSPFVKGDVILEAVFSAAKGDRQQLKQQREGFTKIRNEKQPKGFSCGSVFKAAVCSKTGERIPAGKIIDDLGLKGLKIGGAIISEKHANFIINTGTAKSSDIQRLINKIKRTVYDSRGIILEEEVVFLTITSAANSDVF